ncbi:MAG TPA: hypothetical protein VFL79_07840 [Terriglobia bacterium]|nr:hypothetical protein [Terriglobia bacterium]
MNGIRPGALRLLAVGHRLGNLALAYEKTGQFDAARRQLQDLISREDTAELHNLPGEVEERSGHYLASANKYQRAGQRDPSKPRFFNLGTEH